MKNINDLFQQLSAHDSDYKSSFESIVFNTARGKILIALIITLNQLMLNEMKLGFYSLNAQYF